MTVIKRYPNRKLYDTEAKQYITLDGIASLIRNGDEVQIVDNATGDDLTAVTLSQVILEQEKKQGGFLPRSVLAGLIKTGGDRLNSIQRTLMSSMGLWHHVDEEIERRVNRLVELGEMTQKEGQIILGKLLSDAFHPDKDAPSHIARRPLTSEVLEDQLHRLQIPTQDDIEKLLEQIDALSEKINQLTKS